MVELLEGLPGFLHSCTTGNMQPLGDIATIVNDTACHIVLCYPVLNFLKLHTFSLSKQCLLLCDQTGRAWFCAIDDHPQILGRQHIFHMYCPHHIVLSIKFSKLKSIA